MALDPVVGWLLALALALLLGRAAFAKASDRLRFLGTLEAYRLLPSPLNAAASVALPTLEGIAAVGLLLNGTRHVAAVGAALIFLVYGFAIASNLSRGRRDLDCGCTGPLERRPIAAWMVVRNGCLAGVALAITAPWNVRPLEATDALTLGVGLPVLMLLWSTVDRLLGDILPRGAALKGSR
jgi:hypothetical protein